MTSFRVYYQHRQHTFDPSAVSLPQDVYRLNCLCCGHYMFYLDVQIVDNTGRKFDG